MIGSGTLVNMAAIIVGAGLGLLARGACRRGSAHHTAGIGLAVLFVGIERDVWSRCSRLKAIF